MRLLLFKGSTSTAFSFTHDSNAKKESRSVLANENFKRVDATQLLQLLRSDLGISDKTLNLVLLANRILPVIIFCSSAVRATNTSPVSSRQMHDLQSQLPFVWATTLQQLLHKTLLPCSESACGTFSLSSALRVRIALCIQICIHIINNGSHILIFKVFVEFI